MKDRCTLDQGGFGNSWMRSDSEPQFEGGSILVVEDDDDIRDLLVTLLEMAGYAVTACATAEHGLNALREETFDFVLTDYALPNRTGSWLLHQAESEGLLDATPALVVTAHPNTPDLNGLEVFHKPFDLDDLVAHVRQRLGGDGSKRPAGNRPVRPPRSSGQDNGANHDECPEPIELILYVSADSPRSANAINNIKRVLSRYRSDKVRLTICDLARDPAIGNADSIAFTPTLVKRSPGPRTYILGHISNPDVLIELLDGCDFDSQT
jgi:CheY-like chemotaxis protein